jgi:hypothetical protein
MPMKVEAELMDGKNIENWLQSTKKGLHNIQKRRIRHERPTPDGWYLAFGYLTVILSTLGFLVEWLTDLPGTKPEA